MDIHSTVKTHRSEYVRVRNHEHVNRYERHAVTLHKGCYDGRVENDRSCMVVHMVRRLACDKQQCQNSALPFVKCAMFEEFLLSVRLSLARQAEFIQNSACSCESNME